jgi:hypothetical protein
MTAAAYSILPESASGSPGIAAWWARRSSRRLASEGCEVLTASREELICATRRAVRPGSRQEPARGGVPRGGQGRRHPCQRHLSGRLPLRQPDDRGQRSSPAPHRVGVEKLMFLGSSCIYPKRAEQPITEEALLTGPLEPTNEWYAIAKIAGIKLARPIAASMAAITSRHADQSLWPGRQFRPEFSHVLPALIRKAHEAKLRGAPSITIWGTGTPAPRIPLRRRLRRCLRLPDEEPIRAPRQYRLGRGYRDHRSRPPGDARCWVIRVRS